ncbi:unnamed protein product [Ostreobium quekettii]|uniref:F5/8 type C domain-containing protein n=1 Tax=Ostreobium quekettii TaxID=121088 RepID=A0A8S1JAI9_9CHLO|nr:unnamed protein product [Ostreobium quekettii]
MPQGPAEKPASNSRSRFEFMPSIAKISLPEEACYRDLAPPIFLGAGDVNYAPACGHQTCASVPRGSPPWMTLDFGNSAFVDSVVVKASHEGTKIRDYELTVGKHQDGNRNPKCPEFELCEFQPFGDVAASCPDATPADYSSGDPQIKLMVRVFRCLLRAFAFFSSPFEALSESHFAVPSGLVYSIHPAPDGCGAEVTGSFIPTPCTHPGDPIVGQVCIDIRGPVREKFAQRRRYQSGGPACAAIPHAGKRLQCQSAYLSVASQVALSAEGPVTSGDSILVVAQLSPRASVDEEIFHVHGPYGTRLRGVQPSAIHGTYYLDVEVGAKAGTIKICIDEDYLREHRFYPAGCLRVFKRNATELPVLSRDLRVDAGATVTQLPHIPKIHVDQIHVGHGDRDVPHTLHAHEDKPLAEYYGLVNEVFIRERHAQRHGKKPSLADLLEAGLQDIASHQRSIQLQLRDRRRRHELLTAPPVLEARVSKGAVSTVSDLTGAPAVAAVREVTSAATEACGRHGVGGFPLCMEVTACRFDALSVGNCGSLNGASGGGRDAEGGCEVGRALAAAQPWLFLVVDALVSSTIEAGGGSDGGQLVFDGDALVAALGHSKCLLQCDLGKACFGLHTVASLLERMEPTFVRQGLALHLTRLACQPLAFSSLLQQLPQVGGMTKMVIPRPSYRRPSPSKAAGLSAYEGAVLDNCLRDLGMDQPEMVACGLKTLFWVYEGRDASFAKLPLLACLACSADSHLRSGEEARAGRDLLAHRSGPARAAVASSLQYFDGIDKDYATAMMAPEAVEEGVEAVRFIVEVYQTLFEQVDSLPEAGRAPEGYDDAIHRVLPLVVAAHKKLADAGDGDAALALADSLIAFENHITADEFASYREEAVVVLGSVLGSAFRPCHSLAGCRPRLDSALREYLPLLDAMNAASHPGAGVHGDVLDHVGASADEALSLLGVRLGGVGRQEGEGWHALLPALERLLEGDGEAGGGRELAGYLGNGMSVAVV